MSDPATITPLSGEIMSGTMGPSRGHRPRHDVVDAEFTTVVRPPVTPQASAIIVPAHPAVVVPVAGLDILGHSTVPQKSARAGFGFWAGGALAAFAAFWMAGGHSLARNIGLSGSTEASQVQVASVTSQITRSGQGAHLVIDGTLANNTAKAAQAPDLVIEVAAIGGGVTRYRLGNGGALIDSYGTRNFSSRLTAPSAGVRSVSVTVAGVR